MIQIDNHEYVQEINKIHQSIVAAEEEYELHKTVLYNRLASYIQTYAPKDLKALTTPPKEFV